MSSIYRGDVIYDGEVGDFKYVLHERVLFWRDTENNTSGNILLEDIEEVYTETIDLADYLNDDDLDDDADEMIVLLRFSMNDEDQENIHELKITPLSKVYSMIETEAQILAGIINDQLLYL